MMQGSLKIDGSVYVDSLAALDSQDKENRDSADLNQPMIQPKSKVCELARVVFPERVSLIAAGHE